jgi:hypothetical protein
MCRVAKLFNPFEDVFALPFVNRHPEGLPAVQGLDDRNRQIATDVCLRFSFLRRLQYLEKLLGVGGRREARKKQVYVDFKCSLSNMWRPAGNRRARRPPSHASSAASTAASSCTPIAVVRSSIG